MAAPVNDSTPATGTEHGVAMPRRVALFLSCAVDFAVPLVGTATQRILEAMGIEVLIPASQSCCGQVALNSGHTGPARTLSRRWVDTFAPFDAVVSPSGSCVATVRHGIQRLAEQGWADEAQEVADRTWELSQFLAEYGADLPMALDARVAWHDSCHMLRTLGERESPRTVLQRIERLQLLELSDSEDCCGFGGTFATTFPELSCTMADRKLRTAAEADLTYLVSADPGCLLHLSGRAQSTGARVPTIHIAELVLQAMAGSPATTGRVHP